MNLSCGCRFLDDKFLPACAEHLMERRAGRDREPMYVAGTFMVKKACQTHPGVVAALVMADVELQSQRRKAAA